MALQENQTYISAGNLSFGDEQNNNNNNNKKKTSFNYRVQKI